MRRVVFLTGLGCGYLLGARAGRDRYEAIMRTARRIADRPEVQGTAGVLQAQAGNLAKSVLDSAVDRVLDRVPERLRPGQPTLN